MTATSRPSTSQELDAPPPLSDATAHWVLVTDREGRQVVSIHCKRTYRIAPDGRCSRAPTQQPLWVAPFCDDEGNEAFCEGDIMPLKSGVDLVVIATCHGRGRTTLDASIAVGAARFTYRLHGKRTCLYTGPGTLRFSAPEPIGELPLRYENAYGGVDPDVPAQRPFDQVFDAMSHQPGLYPRNPMGKGYVVLERRERLDGLELPQIEHPAQLLRPNNLVVGHPSRWWQAPIPWSCDWFDRTWYPRSNGYGVLPEYVPDDDRSMWEVATGWVAPHQAKRMAHDLPTLDPCLFNAASPALVLPFLRGDESIELLEMTPEGRLAIDLPGERPRFHVRFGGRVEEITDRARPQRVLISTEEMAMSIVWQATWRTPRVLPDTEPGPNQDLASWIGVEAFVDLLPVTMAL